MNKFMSEAVGEAKKGMRSNDGGPFGAVVVRKGKIISRAHNQVLKTNDPTAHAEIQAIRAASKKLKKFDLSDCELYTSCYPCPMCLSTILWSRIKKVYYACTPKQAQSIGFDDKVFYDTVKNPSRNKLVKLIQSYSKECLFPFNEWDKKKDKKAY